MNSRYAHSIKNPNTIHYVIWRTYKGFAPAGNEKRFKVFGYMCNGACSITKSKSTRIKTRVTCRNCLRKLKNERRRK